MRTSMLVNRGSQCTGPPVRTGSYDYGGPAHVSTRHDCGELGSGSTPGKRYSTLVADVTTSAFTQAIGGVDAIRSLRHVQASDCLAGEQILDVLRRAVWITAAHRSFITGVGFAEPRVEQMLAGRPRPAPPPSAKDDPTGVTRFAIVSN